MIFYQSIGLIFKIKKSFILNVNGKRSKNDFITSSSNDF